MQTKKIILVSSFLLFFFGVSSLSANVSPDWEESLRVHLNTLIGSESFSLESLNINVSEKKISGSGTFFKQRGIGLSAAFHENNQLAFFEASFPNSTNLSIANKLFKAVSGKHIKNWIPKELEDKLVFEGFNFRLSEDDKEIQQLQLFFNTLSDWELLQGTSFQLEKVKVQMVVDYPKDKAKRFTSGELKGITQLGGVPLLLSAQLSENKEELTFVGNTTGISLEKSLHSIIGRSQILGLNIPNSVLDLDLDDTEFSIAPYQKWITLAAVSNFGDVDLFVQKKEKVKKDEGKFFYTVMLSPPAGFKLSKINQKLKVLDAVDLSNQKIVISSEKKSKKESSKIPSLAQVKAGIKKGCNFIAKIDITKLRLEHLLKVKELVVNSALSDKLADVVLESELETNIKLGSTAELTGVLFRLKPSPKDFAISLAGIMTTQIQKDVLDFMGGVEIELSNQKLNFLSKMNGTWNEPLGAKGLVMSDVGFQMGASFTTAPVILPNLALDGDLKIGKFEGGAAIAFDSRNPAKSMMSVNFNKLGLSDVVNTVVVKKVRNAIPKKTMETLEKIFMKDVLMEFVPQPLEVLGTNYEPGFRAGGAINVVGLEGSADMDISYSNGIMVQGAVDPINMGIFKLKGAEGKPKPALTIDLRKGKKAKVAINGLVSLLGMSGQTDVEVLPNGFRFKLGGKLFHLFDGSIDAKGADLQKLGDMQLQVNMKNDLLNFIDENVTKFVKNSTGSAVKKLTNGQNKITAAQKKVKKIDNEIIAKRKEIEKKQSKNRSKFNAAKKKVGEWQTNVKNNDSKIKSIKKQIKKLKKHQVVKRAGLEAKLKSAQAAKGLAWAGLEAAKKVLDGLKWVNSDPNKDPRVVSLYAKRETALKSLDAAKLFLEGLKKTLGFTGKAATFVIEKGADALVNIREANFKGQLGSMSGGVVDLSTNLEWMGKKKKVRFKFDFNDAAASVKNLAKELLKKD